MFRSTAAPDPLVQDPAEAGLPDAAAADVLTAAVPVHVRPAPVHVPAPVPAAAVPDAHIRTSIRPILSSSS